MVRLRRIADQSTGQSRQVWRTEIDGPVAAYEVLPLAAVAVPGAVDVVDIEPMIAIGPEGGWTDDELALSQRRVGLGDSILRVETAAIAATTLRLIR